MISDLHGKFASADERTSIELEQAPTASVAISILFLQPSERNVYVIEPTISRPSSNKKSE